MSPRSTQTLHYSRDFQHFLPITLVGFERGDLLGERFALLQSGGAIDDRPADRLGPAQSGSFKLVQRAQRFVVQAETNRNSHQEIVSRFVIHDLSTRWANSPRATGNRAGDTHDRVRRDRVDADGKLTLRVNGRLHHIGIGRTLARTPVLMLVHDLHIRVINAATGELLRELTLDPTRDYQPTGRPPGPPPKTPRPR